MIHYIEARHPEPTLIPADAKPRGKTIWYEEFADTLLFSCGAKIFFNRIVAPRFMGRPGDLEAAEQADSTNCRRSSSILRRLLRATVAIL